MTRQLQFSRVIWLLALPALILIGQQQAFAQSFEEIGGPYEVDDSTVVLLHFNDSFENASDSTADPVPHGNSGFQATVPYPELQKALYLDNNVTSDSSYLHIPDTAALDLTESWTMEAWVFILTFGETGEDHRWRPKLLVKPGGDVRSHSNYYNVIRGDLRNFNTGFWSPSGGGWFDIRSPVNSFNPQSWYHVTFIRDAEHNALIQLIHNQNRELVHFTSASYDPLTHEPPASTTTPAYIGINLGQPGGWLDGLVDELRISNAVRNFKAPPVLTNVQHPLEPQPDEPIDITASAFAIGDAELSSTTLYYRTDSGASFQSVAMTQDTSADSYVASIPAQEVGSTVSYYVEARINSELVTTRPEGATNSENPSYFGFVVPQDSAQSLYLTFENDVEGRPTNEAYPSFTVDTLANVSYVQENAPGAAGNRAIHLDDGYLQVSPPEASYMNGTDFTIDFWFKADSLFDGGTRFIIKEGTSSWNSFNYQIWSSGNGDITPALYQPDGSNTRTGDITGFDSTFVPGQWYRVVYSGISNDTTFARLYDADNNLLQETGGAINGAIFQGGGPFRIGAHTPAINDEGVPVGPSVHAVIDEVKFYNYVPSEYIGTDVDDHTSGLPGKISLGKNYPNPFSGRTTISFAMNRSENMTLTVYDVLGRKVRTLVDSRIPAGSHTVTFDATDLASGIYFYRLATENTLKTRKMVVLSK